MTRTKAHRPALDEAQIRIIEARHHDPFEVLGPHEHGGQVSLCAHLPWAESVEIEELGESLARIDGTDLFLWQGRAGTLPPHYHLRWQSKDGHWQSHVDPYSFAPLLSDFDMHLFGEGHHWHIYRILGAHLCTVDGIDGVRFATWAPNAERVSVVGDFNRWDGRCHPMRVRGASGLWELFIPGLPDGSLYKFEIRNRDSGQIMLKTDPYGQAFELRPLTAAVVHDDSRYQWGDAEWQKMRAATDWLHRPVSIYEVHPGSWRRRGDGGFLDYRELAHRLVEHVTALGFTHIELMPITEHPLDASWGYQTTGYFAPTRRFGEPDDFRYFVDYCHQHGIGVLLDWVPAHFPRDDFGLARFDGTALYEHEDPRRGEHRDWGTLIYNYGRPEVRNFLIASANFWLEEYHLDGLRVDAVASMLYLDYSREPDDWSPNIYGGNENLEAIDFLRQLNDVTHGEHPGTLMIAEESTAWPQVSRPTWLGGLGFTLKWNLGWMHDTLDYMQKDPVHRHFHHDQLTFGLLYAFTENFVLPFSHDEVVHGKRSLLYRMPGDEWQRFANLRLLYTYMYTYPGAKLLFMGNELAQGDEWNHDGELDWYLLEFPLHRGVHTLLADLNRVYRAEPALHACSFEARGFEWIDCHDASQSVLSYLRRGNDEMVVVVLNFTPIPRHHYRIGLPAAGTWREILNSDSTYYAGSNCGNYGELHSEDIPWMNRPCSLELSLPPLGGVILKLERHA
ncbi:MAG TPA: 1,4-alpha-glucan branching protein GlgB [Gammaproteobacteria bacterium]|nr:1,4-alpha-glucan branching protein GlgB [Gammaproteobacteria bacterium]